MRRKRAAALSFLAWALLNGGCVSLAETGGRVLDGSAFAEKTLAAYREEPERGTRVDRLRDRAGQEFIAIRVDAMPNLRIIGSLPDGEGNFFVNSLDFLSPNLNGWNEFTLELSGEGSFVEGYSAGGATTAVLQLREPLEALDISGGKLRRFSARLSGAQALTALRNRRERITVLARWMKEQEGLPVFSGQADFEAYWEPLLFPELSRPKDRPAAWTGAGEYVVGEDIRWNLAYTRALFPEDLWPVRNSGTLLRDWEEAAPWIRLEFEWDNIVKFLSGKVDLTKIK
ncbi:MAG: hypothetical protein LBG14_01970 [Treponema sp.]|jgi:hypothetical protein|nr:hypothetical protein [Treponema sp.]